MAGYWLVISAIVSKYSALNRRWQAARTDNRNRPADDPYRGINVVCRRWMTVCRTGADIQLYFVGNQRLFTR